MPNLLEFLRQRNIFGVPPLSGGIGNGLSSPNPASLDMSGVYGGGPSEDFNFGADNPLVIPPSDMAPSPEYNIDARMRELYNPTNDATQNFEGMVNNYPTREKPSKLRRLGAMLIDYTKGPKAGQDFYNEPFNDKLTDWKNKLGPAQSAANLERYENVNNRTMAYQTISNELREKAQASKDRNDEAKAKVSQQRADVYKFKAENPHLEFNYLGPKIKVINPQTGEITETEWDSGNLTATDKINLNQKNAMARIGFTGVQNRLTEDTRQTGRETMAETRGWGDPVMIKDKTGKEVAVSINKITGEVKEVKIKDENIGPIVRPPSGGAVGRVEQPTQTKVRQYNAARELVNSRPDLAPFINLTSANEFTITPQSTNTGLTGYFKGPKSGPTPEQFKQINDAIYGKGGISPIASHGSTNAPKAPVGWKYVPKPGGGWTAVEDRPGGEF
jgi:hypothetical protein